MARPVRSLQQWQTPTFRGLTQLEFFTLHVQGWVSKGFCSHGHMGTRAGGSMFWTYAL